MFELLWICLIPDFTLLLKEEEISLKEDDCEWGYFVDID